MTTHASQAGRKRSARKPVQKATVIETAHEILSKAASPVDKRILDRIQKCLNRAHHANTSEAEAKAALFVSQKLMSHHNVTQADLMASDNNSNKAHYGGRSVVSITRTGSSSKRVTKEAFAMKLATTMGTLFDCKSFSTDFRTSLQWTFFGIAQNTVAAAMGFQFAHNQILDWAGAYKGGTTTFSYRLGVADGLAAMAYCEKKREFEQVQRKELDLIAAKESEESKKRQREVNRLHLLPTSKADSSSPSDSEDKLLVPKSPSLDMADSGMDSDSEPDEVDVLVFKADFNIDDAQIQNFGDDLDDSINRFVKDESSEPSNSIEIPKYSMGSEATVKPESSPTSVTSPWESGMQLAQFRATAEQVADDYLKQNNIKLRSGRKRSSNVRDLCAYQRGKQDSSKIQIRRQPLA
ncbi:uncharacterized protein N7506_000225 [Penicillium brevicompactum]|uniref:uncharacterized protein n=1 Tax=Penicillium brevicompactum TaxID=5074 RepID=UPI0025411977|nr:uncharacterized protein N7506_000225 [Penicillium brevicompactum]KAJ5346972.1 hypothetical protein N7506_000225 [Penicillium brevicompactum]